MDDCQRARGVEIAQKEMAKRVAEENRMLAANKKRQEVQKEVLDSMKAQAETHSQKITYSTMIR